MADIFWDPDNGNDANNGLSFANRVRTLNRAYAVGTNGDRLLIKQAPRLMTNVSCWGYFNTNQFKSKTGSIGTFQSLDMFNSTTGWVTSTGVTVALHTATRKHPTGCLAFSTTGTYTTGKMAYKAISFSTNSLHSVLSLLALQATNNTGRTMEIRLCSDAVGDVAVYTIPITCYNASAAANQIWTPVVAAIGALGTSISSISLWGTGFSGTNTNALRIQNLISTVAKSDSAYLGHDVVFKVKNELSDDPRFNYLAKIRLIGAETSDPFGAITDTVSLELGENISSLGNAGDTISQVAFCPSAANYTFPSSIHQSILVTKYISQDYGTPPGTTISAKLFNIFGGMNATDMTTRTSDEDMSIPCFWFAAPASGSQTDFVTTSAGISTMSHVGLIDSRTGIGTTIISPNQVYISYLAQARLNLSPSNNINFKTATQYTDNTFTSNNDFAFSLLTSFPTLGNGRFVFNKMFAAIGSSSSTTTYSLRDSYIKELIVFGNGAYFNDNNNIEVETLRLTTSNIGPLSRLIFEGGSARIRNFILTPTADSNSTGIFQIGINKISIRKSNVDVKTLTSINTTQQANQMVGQLNIRDNNSIESISITGQGDIYSQTAERNTPSGLAWAFKPLTTTQVNENYPLTGPISNAYLNPSLTYKAKVYIKRTSAAQVVVFRPSIISSVDTISSEKVTISGATGVGSWVQYEFTFNTNEGGPFEFVIDTYGSTSPIFVDDFELEQQ